MLKVKKGMRATLVRTVYSKCFNPPGVDCAISFLNNPNSGGRGLIINLVSTLY